MSEPATNSHLLDAERALQLTFARALKQTEPQETPKAILLGGQPGSGKTPLRAMAFLGFQGHGGAVVIDSDQMREANPRYHDLLKADPQNAADLTHFEAAQWAKQLTSMAIDGHRNLVIDGTLRDPQGVRALTERLAEAGYETEVWAMAVNPVTSLARARLRFEAQFDAHGAGRFVNVQQHNAAYQGMTESIKMLETEGLIDRLQLFDAQQRSIYENQRLNGQWQAEPQALATLQAERSREWTVAERGGHAATLEAIVTLSRRRELGTGDTGNVVRLDPAEQQTQREVFRKALAMQEIPVQEMELILAGIEGKSNAAPISARSAVSSKPDSVAENTPVPKLPTVPVPSRSNPQP